MKALRIIFRILLALVLFMPVLGTLGVFPSPTADMYTPQGWAFMSALMATPYMMPLVGITCLIGFILTIMNRMALAAIILAPLTVNVMLFHWFLDAAPISGSSVFGYILLISNLFFLYTERNKYRALWA